MLSLENRDNYFQSKVPVDRNSSNLNSDELEEASSHDVNSLGRRISDVVDRSKEAQERIVQSLKENQVSQENRGEKALHLLVLDETEEEQGGDAFSLLLDDTDEEQEEDALSLLLDDTDEEQETGDSSINKNANENTQDTKDFTSHLAVLRDSNGRTALHFNAMIGDTEKIKSILEDGIIDVNTQDNKGRTPLHLATLCKDDPKIVEIFLENGANVDAIDSKGNTLLHLAISKGHIEIARLFAKHMKNRTIVNHDGFTPLTIARFQPSFQNHDDLLNLLEDNGYTDRFWINKFLVNRHGIKDSTLEGLYPGMGFFELTRSFESFLNNENNMTNVFTKEVGHNILELLKNAHKNMNKTSKQLYEEYNEGKPILLPTGWKSHATIIFISKDFRLVMKGNRGEMSNGIDPGVGLFKIEDDLTLADFEMLTNYSQEYFEKGINQKLSKLEGFLKMKPQKNGDCEWAAAKMALFMAAYITLISKGENSDTARTTAVGIYKNFTSGEGGDRETALKHAIAGYKEKGVNESELKILRTIMKEGKYKGSAAGLEEIKSFLRFCYIDLNMR